MPPDEEEELDLWLGAQVPQYLEVLGHVSELLEDIDEKLRGPYEMNHPRLFKRIDEVLADIRRVM